MAVAEFDTNAEERAHRRTFVTFERLILFAVMHIALILSSLALAFLGHVPLIAVLLGVGGTVALIAAFAIVGSQSTVSRGSASNRPGLVVGSRLNGTTG
jgi:hypothetical protein